MAIDLLKPFRTTPATNGAAAPTERKGVTFAPGFIPLDGQGHTIDVAGGVFPDRQVTLQNIYIASSYVYAAMHWRAWKYSEAPLFVARHVPPNEEEWLPDHELAELFRIPHGDLDQGTLLRVTRMYRDLTGMAIWHKERNAAGGIARLTPYSADEFTLMPDPAGERIYGGVNLKTRRGPRRLSMDEVVLFREINPYDWYTGVAPARVALEAVRLTRQMTRAIGKVTKNAAFRSAMILTPKDWNPQDDEWEVWKQSLKRAMQEHNEGDPFIAHGAETVIPVSMNMRELAPAEVYDRIEAVIASIFGVPAVVLQYLVGLKNSPWSQMGEARRMAIEDTIDPMWRADAEILTRQLLHAPLEPGGRRIDDDPMSFIGFDSANVRGLQNDLLVASDVALKNKDIWTVNERRVHTGMEPLDDAFGDEIVATTSTAPVAQVNAASRRPHDRKQNDLELVYMAHRLLTERQAFAYFANTSAQLARDQQVMVELANETLREEKQIEPSSVGRFEAAVDAYYDGPGKTAWTEVMFPLTAKTAAESVQATAARMGLSFAVLEPGIAGYVETRTAEVVAELSDTTKRDLKNTVLKGLEEGDSIPQIAARIQTATTFDQARAELIARTETTAVTNAASRESLSAWGAETGVRIEKTWLSARDDRVRPEHAELDNGEWIPIDEPFANGLQQPGDWDADAAETVNCRCTLLERIAE